MASLIPVAATVDVSAVEQDNVYAGTSNTMRAAFQALGAQQNKLSLPSKRLGANQQLNLVSGPLLGFTMLALKLDKAALVTNIGLEAGWGYRAISYLEMSMGDSTTLRISGDHILQKVLADCENKDKRGDILSLGGAAKAADATGTPALDPVAYIALPLPFSNTGASRSLMFDSAILQRPVTIRIQFATPDQLFLRSNGTSTAFPTEFKDAYVVSKTAIMTNPSQSIRDLVGPSGPASYSQPFMYPNSWTSSQVIGSYPQSGTALASVRMDGFQNGSVMSIDLWLRLESYELSGSTTYQASAVPYPSNAYLPMRDISVLYGGQVMWQSDDETDALISLSEYGAGASFDVEIPTTLAGGVAASHVSKWYHVQLSLQNETYFTNLVQHGANLVNNTVEVRFHTPELSEIRAPGAPLNTNPTDATFRLYANVNYQAAVRVAKGSASFDFVPPVPLLQGTITGNVPYR